MLERGNDPRFAAIAQPSDHALMLLKRVLEGNPAPMIAEVGIGIGATSLELCRLLDGRGEIAFFDRSEKLDELATDLQANGFSNIRMYGNSRRTFDSYCWPLMTLLREMHAVEQNGIYDFIYMDGAHLFHHDAPATLFCKELVKPGGILLMDDYDWSIAVSPTMNPEINPGVVKHFTDEQIETPHVRLICEFFLDRDPNFSKLDIGYHTHEHRRAYQRAGAVS